MYAIQVTRHAGEALGHVFERDVRIMQDGGVDNTFYEQAAAQRVADHYAQQHAVDEYAICRKTYKVIPI